MSVLPHCRHDVRQTAEHMFECLRCGTIFLGIDRRDPNLGRTIDSINRGHGLADTYLGSSDGKTIDREFIHVDLGSMPEDVTLLKAKMDELERTLSLFADILKHALQT